ncbi:SAUR-like auxin-responsive protein family [Zea mays]|uniref:SAUR-like auxin-responsive protein family n=1 Tax=Zea mays TaxID=4577 RepID=A0A1D6FCP3_MAIZE|nr:SAUR-like auxin-responsive protein family [Zea mays]
MRLPSDVSHGHFAVYVGEWWRRFVVHIALLDRPEFRSLLRRAEEEFGFTGAGGALVLPYEEVAFRSLTSALACARLDDDLVELLWHNGSVVAQPQAHHRPAPPSDRDRPGTSGLTAEETAAWFLNTLDDPLEKDLYTQLWYNTIADAAPQHEGTFPGPTSHPSSPPPPVGSSGVESSWAGDICSTFCGSNQVPRTPTGIRGKDAALQSERRRDRIKEKMRALQELIPHCNKVQVP